MSRATPPPDHLIPLSWLEKAGVTEDELKMWTAAGTLVKVDIHGGASFFHFPFISKPVKFREIASLIEKARNK